MTNIIVPIDFSTTSYNAAHYASQLVKDHKGLTMVLYHMYNSPSDEAEAASELGRLQIVLTEKNPVKITTLLKQGSDLIDELEKEVKIQAANLIVMGITGRSALAQKFIGSNTLKMAERKVCPVLIVQENAEYSDIKNVMLASDMQNAYYSTPVEPIKKFLKTFKPKLNIVNVNSDHYVAITESYEKEKKALQDLFKEFNPEFYFIRLFDREDAIHLFATEKDIDLVITIQKDHSLLHKLFKASDTKNLTYHSSVPVLVVHE